MDFVHLPQPQAEDALVAETRFLRTQTDVARVAMASLQPDVLRSSLLEAIGRAQGYAAGLFWQVLEGAQTATVVATFNAEITPFLGFCIHIDDPDSFTAQTIRSRQPLCHNHVQQSRFASQPLNQALEVKALLALPLIARTGQVIGILSFCDSENAERFTELDLRQGIVLAAQVAQVLENSELFHQQVQHKEEIRTLLEINKTLGQVRELPVLLNTMAQEAARLLAVPEVIFRLYDGSELRLAGAWAQSGTETILPSMQIGESLSGRVVQTREPLVIHDLRLDDRLVPESRARLMQRNYVSYLGVPLLLGAEVIGVMAFNAERTRVFTDHDRDLAVAFADQAAIAVQHARLYVQAERRRVAAESLINITQFLSESLDPTEVGQRIVDAIKPLLAAQGALLFQLEPQSGDLQAMALSSNSPMLADRPRLLPQDTSVAGLAVRARRPMVSSNTLTDPRLPMTSAFRAQIEQLPPCAVLAVPLLLQDEVIGLLSIMDVAGREFTEEEIHLVQAFATQATTALRNARLYQEAQEAYRQLVHTQQQFIQAQKMEAVGQLAGGVAHDFNNLLTVILGRTQLQLMRLPVDHPMRRDVELIQSTAERAATLTQQLLAFSRRQFLQPKVLNLNTVVHEISLLLQRLLGDDIALVTVLDPTLGQVRADPGQLGQVLLNLAVNARDAMPLGGQLTIETANITWEEDDGRGAPEMPSGQYVQLRVCDTGTGMDTAVQTHLFEPFFTTKEVGKGTGLGLATVYGIVTQSGGYIAVDTVLGHGTTFSLYLPRVDAASAASTPGQTRTALLREQATILLVEDEAGIRELVYDILTTTGYRVLSASSGAEALQRCEQHPGAIDLLLTDVVMPGMSGHELAIQVLRRWPHVKTLYISGYTDEILGRYGAVNASLAFLKKPFTPESLTHKVREVLLETVQSSLHPTQA